MPSCCDSACVSRGQGPRGGFLPAERSEGVNWPHELPAMGGKLRVSHRSQQLCNAHNAGVQQGWPLPPLLAQPVPMRQDRAFATWGIPSVGCAVLVRSQSSLRLCRVLAAPGEMWIWAAPRAQGAAPQHSTRDAWDAAASGLCS